MSAAPAPHPAPSGQQQSSRAAGAVTAFLLWWAVCIMAGMFTGLVQSLGGLWVAAGARVENILDFRFFLVTAFFFGAGWTLPALVVGFLMGPVVALVAVALIRVRGIVNVVTAAAIGSVLLGGALFATLSVTGQYGASRDEVPWGAYIIVAFYVAAATTVATLGSRALLEYRR